ncbi:type I methionyl aminopeptidase [Candidatus Dependentiae bacterium]|nr:type I methionyl aminopeptidase [Candidatus Dependentiae bacterium]
MITIKNKAAIAKMEEAGKRLATIFDKLPSIIEVGLSTLAIDAWIEERQRQYGLVSKSKGYKGYKYVSCISVNDEVVHGVPSVAKKLQVGDLVKVDVCAAWNGYCADMARMYFVENAAPRSQQFVEAAQRSLNQGIAKAYAGNRLSDISYAIQSEIEASSYGIVRDFAGHGIGKMMHEDPEILNFGQPGHGPILRPGMALALEPMITMGSHKIVVLDDGWTAKTVDGSLAAHIEDTVIITDAEPKIITRPGT